MKIALTILRWCGFVLSLLTSLVFLLLLVVNVVGCILIIFAIFLPVPIYGLVVNSIATFKHLKCKRSIKCGVFQIVSIVGTFPGVIMILSKYLEKMQIAKELEEGLKAIDCIES